MKYIIYKITNTINNKSYIGLTRTTLLRRWITHKSTAKTRKTDWKFSRAIKKYSEDVWIKEELCTAFGLENAAYLEKELIREYDTYYTGYNSSKGGEIHEKYKKKNSWNEERKNRQSEMMKERGHRPKIMYGKANPSFGKPGTMTGKHHTAETKDRLKKAWQDPKRKENLSLRFSKVVVFNNHTFQSKATAAKKLGFHSRNHMDKYLKLDDNNVLCWIKIPSKTNKRSAHIWNLYVKTLKYQWSD